MTPHQIQTTPDNAPALSSTEAKPASNAASCCEPHGELCDCSDPECGAGCGCC